mmetsp:Transcript_14488/g.23980  ORF Transcript_14488/g.23980 Transcript_14488/m.23980 type:complete len:551 (-) Transcript_14488:144-1796(-)|eukprot:CAMPEP_0184664476 /NCGR_PEP_ID=MMETSP0308-20130426/52979_1 /TAXON_ID=38269 /ORGANISM="Gloeochaete witrockiana, Strain SAG 46.84" /LENGTH=550 /DNA_ID=CAMNT_0027107903 /DNA_START=73 /DNA_END=1725 /DNA_ORIENTATION=-
MGRQVTVDCKLDKLSYFPGDTLKAKITISNSLSSGSSRSISSLVASLSVGQSNFSTTGEPNPTPVELIDAIDIEWLAVQLHGQAVVSSQWISLPTNPQPPKLEKEAGPDGKFSIPNFVQAEETGRCIFVTKPTPLIREQKVPIGTGREFSYSAILPTSLPPTFRGTSVRYSYNIAVGVEEKKGKVKVLKCAFRVLVNPGSGMLLSIFPGYPDLEDGGVKVKEIFTRGQVLSQRPDEQGASVAKADDAESTMSGGKGTAAGATSVAGCPLKKRVESWDAGSRVESMTDLQSEAGGVANAGEEEEDDDDEEEERGWAGPVAEAVETFAVDPEFVPSGLVGTGWGGLDQDLVDPSDMIEILQGPTFYNIRKGDITLVRFALGRESFRIGELVTGTFDFSDGLVPCHQISVKLETEEIVTTSVLNHTKAKSPSIRKLYGEHHELTINTRHTHFMFFVPYDASADFTTDIVSLRWMLEVEFVTAKSQPETSAKRGLLGGLTGVESKAVPTEKQLLEWPVAKSGPVEVLQWRTCVPMQNPKQPMSGGLAQTTSISI